MSPAAGAGSPPGPRSESPGAAELLCALFCGCGLAVAEHGTNTAFAGVQLERVLAPALPAGLQERTPSWSATANKQRREGRMTGRCARNTGLPGAHPVREE
jgi:hypothetical protein